MSSYKSNKLAVADGDALLAEELNIFFARFEVDQPEMAASYSSSRDRHILTLKEHEMQRTLRGVNLRTAAGPDGVAGHVLKSCANKLAGILTRIFNQSLSQYTVPPCLKSSVIVPVPKKDYDQQSKWLPSSGTYTNS